MSNPQDGKEVLSGRSIGADGAVSATFALERLDDAVQELHRSTDTLQLRLESAQTSLQLLRLSDFPSPEMRQLYEEIMVQLAIVPDPELGAMPRTLGTMSDEQALTIARSVTTLRDRVNRYCLAKPADTLL